MSPEDTESEASSAASSLSPTTTDGPPDSTDTSASTVSSDQVDDSGSDASASDSESGGDVCGDGRITGDEWCDDGVNDGTYGGCARDCTLGPRCGDGVLQRPQGEACDDGDGDAGDGCNPDCVVSGTRLWCTVLPTPNGHRREANAVAIAPDDTMVVVGYESSDIGAPRYASMYALMPDGDPTWDDAWLPMAADDAEANAVAIGGGIVVMTGSVDDRDIFVRAHGLNGAWLWQDRIPNTGPMLSYGGGYGVAVDENGGSFVSGRTVDAEGRDVWLRRYDVSGNATWTVEVDGDANDNAGPLVLSRMSGDWFAVAGHVSANPWMRRYDLDGASAWTKTEPGPALVGLAIDPQDNVVVLARGGNVAALRKLGADGKTIWTTSDIDIDAQGTCTSSDGSSVITGEQDDLPTIRKYDASGEELWTIPVQPTGAPSEGNMGGCAVDSQDDIVVVGYVATGDFTADAFVCKFAP